MKRNAFTLIELLVVMSLIAILAALTIMFFPSAASSARESRAATQVQGWLNVAKQRALRDQAPRGLRLWISTPTIGATTFTNAVVECQYTEQPDDFTGGTVQSGVFAPPAPGYTMQNCLMFTGVDLFNGHAPSAANERYYSVQRGDYIELLGSGLMHRIVEVGVPNGAVPPAFSPSHIRIEPPLLHTIQTPTPSYRIVRAPRAVGDETLKLPENTLIDLNTNVTYAAIGGQLPPPTTSDSGFIDITFGPSGAVISPGLVTDKVHLWIRSPNPDVPTGAGAEFRGDPTLISIFVRTGFVGAYQPAQAGNPYQLVR
jgi:prepilin-type N-terminal cleavage/methylation domain-containing protein